MVKVYIADATVLKDEQLYRRLYTGLDVSRILQGKSEYILICPIQKVW